MQISHKKNFKADVCGISINIISDKLLYTPFLKENIWPLSLSSAKGLQHCDRWIVTMPLLKPLEIRVI